MTEDRFESFLKKNAESYNAPPARAPREEMWEAIQAARQGGPRVVYGGGSNSVSATHGRFGSKVWLSAAAAAVVLVATGVGIGRWSASSDAPAAVTTTTPAARPAAPEPTGIDDPASGIEQPALIADGGAASTRPAAGRSPASGQSSSAGSEPSSGTSAAAGSWSAGGAASSSAYQVAAVNHLTQAEALLTSFRTRAPADQRVDAQLSSWARELLSNTRLLLDSPLAVDPQRRPLLQDLELLLVQIVQLSPGSTPQDREIIEQTLKQDQVLTRLRTAIPAGERGS